MVTIAFSAPAPIVKSAVTLTKIPNTSSLHPRFSSAVVSSTTIRASTADVFQWRSQTKEAKEAATSSGIYTVQCTEGTSKSNDANTKRTATLTTQFRLRQASPSTVYADLFATRRAAIVLCDGSHTMEQYCVNFPARASSFVQGTAEKDLACSRYMNDQGKSESADKVMQGCVIDQYKATKVPGEYSTMCSDGAAKEEAEHARVSAMAVTFKAGQLTKKQSTQARYNAIARATKLGRGCEYEEAYFQGFPSTAAAMQAGPGVTGAYAAKVVGTLFETGGNKGLTVAEQLASGVNVESFWPSFQMRPAVTKEKSSVKFWSIAPSPIKSYAYMSSAAVAWGTDGQGKVQVKNYADTWSSGWQPKSSIEAGN